MLLLKDYPSNSTVLDNIRCNYIAYRELVIKISRSILPQVLFLKMMRGLCSLLLSPADSNCYHRTLSPVPPERLLC